MISYVTFVLSVYSSSLLVLVPRAKTVLRDCGISWVSSLKCLPETLKNWHNKSPKKTYFSLFYDLTNEGDFGKISNSATVHTEINSI